MSEPRQRLGRAANRSNVVKLAFLGVILCGAAVWALVTSRGAEFVLVLGAVGLVSLALSVVFHRWLLGRGEL